MQAPVPSRLSMRSTKGSTLSLGTTTWMVPAKATTMNACRSTQRAIDGDGELREHALTQGKRDHGVLVISGETNVLQVFCRHDARAIGQVYETLGIIATQGLDAPLHETKLLEESQAAQGNEIAVLRTNAADVVDILVHGDVTKLCDVEGVSRILHVLRDAREGARRVLVPTSATYEKIGIAIAGRRQDDFAYRRIHAIGEIHENDAAKRAGDLVHNATGLAKESPLGMQGHLR